MTFCNSFKLETGRGREAGSWRICSLEFRQDQRWDAVWNTLKEQLSSEPFSTLQIWPDFKDVLVSQKLMCDFFGDQWMKVLMRWNISSNPAAAMPAGPAHCSLCPWEGHKCHLPLAQPWLWDWISLGQTLSLPLLCLGQIFGSTAAPGCPPGVWTGIWRDLTFISSIFPWTRGLNVLYLITWCSLSRCYLNFLLKLAQMP